MNRRSFISSILALGVAPAIVRASSLMPVYAPKYTADVSDGAYLWAGDPPEVWYITMFTADGKEWRQSIPIHHRDYDGGQIHIPEIKFPVATESTVITSAAARIVVDGIRRTVPLGFTGADSLAKQWAIDNDIPCETYIAYWEEHGRASGPIRNRQMLDEGKPNLVIAFPGGRDTADMVQQATNRGVPVTEVSDE